MIMMNKRYLVLCISAILYGCGVTGLTSQSESTNYVMASSGDAGLIYKIFTGEVLYCKATKKGMDNIELSINFSEGVCIVKSTKSRKTVTGIDLQ